MCRVLHNINTRRRMDKADKKCEAAKEAMRESVKEIKEQFPETSNVELIYFKLGFIAGIEFMSEGECKDAEDLVKH